MTFRPRFFSLNSRIIKKGKYYFVMIFLFASIFQIHIAYGDFWSDALGTICDFNGEEVIDDYSHIPSPNVANDWTVSSCAADWQAYLINPSRNVNSFWATADTGIPAGPDNANAPIKCVTGQIKMLGESTFDGDIHINLDPNGINSQGVQALMNQNNLDSSMATDPTTGVQSPTMVVELPPQDRPAFSSVLPLLRGQMEVNVCGYWVTDNAPEEGWNELHPVYSLSVVGTPFSLYCSSPVAPSGPSINGVQLAPGQSIDISCQLNTPMSNSPVSITCNTTGGLTCVHPSEIDRSKTTIMNMHCGGECSTSMQEACDMTTMGMPPTWCPDQMQEYQIPFSITVTNNGSVSPFADISLSGTSDNGGSNSVFDLSKAVQPLGYPMVSAEQNVQICPPGTKSIQQTPSCDIPFSKASSGDVIFYKFFFMNEGPGSALMSAKYFSAHYSSACINDGLDIPTTVVGALNSQCQGGSCSPSKIPPPQNGPEYGIGLYELANLPSTKLSPTWSVTNNVVFSVSPSAPNNSTFTAFSLIGNKTNETSFETQSGFIQLPVCEYKINDNLPLSALTYEKEKAFENLGLLAQEKYSGSQPIKIPYWVKTVAKDWSSNQIDDSTFLQAMQYMVQNKIILIQGSSSTHSQSPTHSVPTWVKNDANYWSQGEIDDKTFAKGMQYLINQGIITP